MPGSLSPSAAPNGRRAFHFDSEAGNDAADGLAEGTAWATLAPLSGVTLGPGDQVLFRRGRKWTGGITVKGSGAPDVPIVLGAYGTGARPLIDGQAKVNCVLAQGRNYIRLEGLELAHGLDSGGMFIRCGFVEVIDCEMHHAGNDNLIFIDDCHDATVQGGKYHDAFARIESYTATGIELTNGGQRFLIEDVECYGNPTGISIHNHTLDNADGTITQTLIPADVIVRNVMCHDNAVRGLFVYKTAPNPPVTITVDGGHFDNNGKYGIQAYHEPKYTPDPITGIKLLHVEASGNGIQDIKVEGVAG